MLTRDGSSNDKLANSYREVLGDDDASYRYEFGMEGQCDGVSFVGGLNKNEPINDPYSQSYNP